MRKSIIISAVLLSAAAAAYLIGIWPSSSIQEPGIVESNPANAPAGAKPGETRSAGAEQKGAAEEIITAVLDVARIDPNGASVFAGRSAPNSLVTVLADDKAIGTVKADKYGEWALLAEKPVPAKDSKITLRATRQRFAAAPKEQSGEASSRKPRPEKFDHLAAVGNRNAGHSAAKEKRGRDGATADAVTARFMEQMKLLVETAKSQAGTVAARDRASPTERYDSEIAPPANTGPRPNRLAEGQPSPNYPGREAGLSGDPATLSFGEANRPGRELRVATAKDIAEPLPTGIVPVPIKFDFNEATFTPEGVEAAKLLLTYIKIKAYKSITLSGHADERGGEPFNYDLSRKRLEAVSDFLRTGGYQGRIVVVPKGETEPYRGVNRSDYSKEELWQLDRRVELHIFE